MDKYYRKKATIKNPMQWFKHGDSPDVSPYCDTVLYVDANKCPECGLELRGHGLVGTLEGFHRVCPGDWIITGVKGEHYPCKPDIFDATYEEVMESC